MRRRKSCMSYISKATPYILLAILIVTIIVMFIIGG
jgi:hypothetical protein